MEFEKTFGETVKKLRENKNLTLREVAEALEIGTSMLGRIEKNERNPTKSHIDKFSRYFKVSAKELRIAFLSDTVVYKVLDNEECASEVLKVAEKKIKYLKIKKRPKA